MRLIFIGAFLVGSLAISAAQAAGAKSDEGKCSSPADRKEAVSVTDDSFEADVLEACGPVLVNYWAEWSGPSKIMGPALEDMAAEMGGVVTFANLNIDDNPMTPQKYGVRGIPTLMLFKDGQVAATKVGAASKDHLIDWVESVLGN